MSEDVKTCVECRHFKGAQNDYVAQMQRQPQEPECSHPRAVSRDLVNGKALCRLERQSQKGCGKKGKLWESKKNENSA